MSFYLYSLTLLSIDIMYIILVILNIALYIRLLSYLSRNAVEKVIEATFIIQYHPINKLKRYDITSIQLGGFNLSGKSSNNLRGSLKTE